MELQPSLTVSQKLTLTPAMRQALRCLQLPVPELSELLQEEALSNPLLNAEPPEHTAGEALSAPEIREAGTSFCIPFSSSSMPYSCHIASIAPSLL